METQNEEVVDEGQLCDDPSLSLKNTVKELESLNKTIADKSLFDLASENGQFVENDLIKEMENIMANVAQVAESSKTFTNQLMKLNNDVRTAVADLSELVSTKLTEEFADLAVLGEADEGNEELMTKIHADALIYEKFVRFQLQFEERTANFVDIVAYLDAASNALEDTQAKKTVWDENMVKVRDIVKSHQKWVEGKEGAERKETESEGGEKNEKDEEEESEKKEKEENDESENNEKEEQSAIENNEKEKREKEKKRRREEEEEERKKTEREEKERKRQERQRRQEEKSLEVNKRKEGNEAERRRMDPKNWAKLEYNSDANGDILCVFRACSTALAQSDLTVQEVQEEKMKNIVPIGFGEELVSTVIDVRSAKGELSFEFPAVLAMQRFSDNNKFFHAVAKIRVDDQEEWITVKAKDTQVGHYKDLAECELPAFSTIRLAFIKTVRVDDTYLIEPNGGVVKSSVEPKMSLIFPPNSVSETTGISLSVRPVDHTTLESLKKHSDGCQNVQSASHMLCVNYDEDVRRFKDFVTVTMPTFQHSKESEDSQSGRGRFKRSVHIWLVEAGKDGQWKVNTNTGSAMESNNSGEFTAKTKSPITRMVALEMTTKSEAEAEFAASKIEEHLDKHVVRIIQRQHEENHYKVVTNCVNTKDVETAMDEIETKGFKEGPAFASKEFLFKEGQEISTSLSQGGNLRKAGYGNDTADAAKTFIYYSRLRRGCFDQFSVEPIDTYGQHSRDFYIGHNEFYTGDKNGRQRKIHEFEIKLPKLTRERAILQRVPLPFPKDSVYDRLFKAIAYDYVEVWWKDSDLAKELKRNGGIFPRQASQHIGTTEESMITGLWGWLKCGRRSESPVELLCDTLTQIGRKRLALKVRKEELKFAFLIVSREVVGEPWKMLARELGLDEDDNVPIDNDEKEVKEKCFQALKVWQQQNGSGATVEELKAALKQIKRQDVIDEINGSYHTGGPTNGTPEHFLPEI